MTAGAASLPRRSGGRPATTPTNPHMQLEQQPSDDRPRRRLEALLADLLDISRMDARAAEVAGEPTDLIALTREAIDSLGQLAVETGSAVRLVAPDGPLDVEVEPRRVARVVRNLLANALEHGEGRPVVVTVALRSFPRRSADSPMISPAASTTTAPTGMSPSATAAAASSRARPIHVSSAGRDGRVRSQLTGPVSRTVVCEACASSSRTTRSSPTS